MLPALTFHLSCSPVESVAHRTAMPSSGGTCSAPSRPRSSERSSTGVSRRQGASASGPTSSRTCIFFCSCLNLQLSKDQYGASRSWVPGEYVGHENFRELFDPPLGTHLEVIGGYMMIGEGPHLCVSEEFSCSACSLANRRFTFEEPITMLKAVVDGVWIATERKTCFLSGTEPEKWGIAQEFPYDVKAGAVLSKPIARTELALEGIGGYGHI